MIGASASAGFTLMEPFGGTNTQKCRLSFYLDAAVAAPHPPVKNLANSLFFLQPEGAGLLQVQTAVAENPTLVIAVDFPFWFCYGRGTNDAERRQRFEHGLQILDPLKCPLVLGDIPDASSATNTGIISPSQVAGEPARTAANRRLREWAAAHPNVVLVPLAEFMRDAIANQPLLVHGRTVPAGSTRAVLQNDRLHPTPIGAATLAVGILDALVSQRPEFSAKDIRWDRAEVYRLGVESALAPVKSRPTQPQAATPAGQ